MARQSSTSSREGQSLQDLKQDLKKGVNLFPCYLLYGEDVDALDEGLQAIRHAYIGSHSSGVSESVLSGFEHGIDKVMDLVSSPSLFAATQFVVVRHAEAMFPKGTGSKKSSTAKPKKSAKKSSPTTELDRFITYLTSPMPGTILVMVYEGKPDMRMKYVKAFDNAGQAYGFFPPRNEREAYYWLKSQITKDGLRATDSVLRTLVDECGTDTTQLRQNVQKLALYLGENGQDITMEAVESVVIHTKIHTIYALQDAVSEGNLSEAISHLRNILRQKDYDAVRVLVWLQIRLKQLYAMAELAGKRYSPQDIVRMVDAKPWLADKLMGYVGRKPLRIWAAAVHELYLADRGVKSSPLPADAIVEQAIIRICGLISGR